MNSQKNISLLPVFIRKEHESFSMYVCVIRYICYMRCVCMEERSVMTGSTAGARLKWAHCRLISIPICLLTSRSRWRLTWCILVVHVGPICPIFTQPATPCQILQISKSGGFDVQQIHAFPIFMLIILLRAFAWVLPPSPNSLMTCPHRKPSPCLCSAGWTQRLTNAGTASHSKGVSGVPRGCGLHSPSGDPMLKECQLGLCHGWCVLKTCRLLCLRVGAFSGSEVQPFLFVSALFLWVVCG